MSDVVHYRGEQAPHAIRTMWWPACGLATTVAGPRVTRSKAKVTCRRCRAKLLGEQGRKRKPLPKVNRKRAAKRKAEAFGEQAIAAREAGCAVAICRPYYRIECDGPVAAHHEPPRSRGGVDRDTVGLCMQHHDLRHRIGEVLFNERYRVDLRRLAAELHARLEKEESR